MNNISKWVVSVGLLMLGSGCAMDVGEAAGEGAGDGKGEVTSSVTQGVSVPCSSFYDSCSEFKDSSGTVTVRVYKCKFSAPSAAPQASCEVEHGLGFAVVGGGAEIENSNTAWPGALLTASYYQIGTERWIAKSKDHTFSFPHRIRSIAIGLKLPGLTDLQMRSARRIVSAVADVPANAQATALAELVDPNRLLIGGGAYTEYFGSGIVLRGSGPFAQGWSVTASSHAHPDSGKVLSQAIYVDRCPAGFTGGCLVREGGSSLFINNGGGYMTGTKAVPAGTAIIGVGARSTGSDPGRPLSALFPNQDGISVATSKDHEIFASGNLTVFALGLRRQ